MNPSVRADFPILAQQVHGRPLAYLDSAASSQMPLPVLRAIDRYQTTDHANVHRGVHLLSQRATEAYEAARATVQGFVNARSTREIVFTRGTTEAINLVSHSWGRKYLGSGDEVLITGLEHHSNIVPWQLACEAAGARLRAVPLTASGEIEFVRLRELTTARTRMIAVAHVSNALGTVLPVREICEFARGRGIATLLDGAQAIAHAPVDVQELDCDFYAFSGHKVYGPTGIGVLYAREEMLRTLPPWQGGGDMILSVSIEASTWNELPWRFEAGTPNISGAIGLGAALDYLTALGRDAVASHELALAESLRAELVKVPGLRLVGTAAERAAVVSFTIDGVHPHDIGTILDSEGVAVRSGHHCAMPVMAFYRLPATVRASFGCYNTAGDVAQLLAGLERVRQVFG